MLLSFLISLLFSTLVQSQSNLTPTTFKAGLVSLLDEKNLKIFSAYAVGSPTFTNNLMLKNQTILVVQDSAWSSLDSNQINNLDYLNGLIAYHTLQISPPFSNSSSIHTVATSTFTDSTKTSVNLPNNSGQVVAFESTSTGLFQFNQLNYRIESQTSFFYDNTFIIILSTLLQPPKYINQVLFASGLHSFYDSIQLASLGFQQSLNNTAGIMLFVPSEGAFLDYGQVNPSNLDSFLSSHIIQTSTIGYSPDLKNGVIYQTLNSMKPIQIIQNQVGTFVLSGSILARVVATDYLTSSGVIHIIDRVLSESYSPPLPVAVDPITTVEPIITSKTSTFIPVSKATLSLTPNVFPPIATEFISGSEKEVELRFRGILMILLIGLLNFEMN